VSGEGDGEPAPAAEPSGPDLARAALARAKARASEKGLTPRRAPRRRPVAPGPARDARDPELFGAAINRLILDRGWEATTTSARVMGEWDRLVGPEIADHCRPTSLVDGELVLVAESSAWATQLRLMSRALLRTLAGQVGPEVVRSVVVRGPVQPDWRKGPRRVQGRGPRDTYG
jgi:predicted nucleic acid-binding Zn ribbon protein